MALSSEKVQRISEEVISILYSRFLQFPSNSLGNRNAPFHEAFLNAFSDQFAQHNIADMPIFISLCNWYHGLSTTIGQKFFENVAYILSDGEKREYTSGRGKLGVLQISSQQHNNISTIITNLTNTGNPNLTSENNLIFAADTAPLVDAMGFTADVYIENNQEIIAIEMKSVKPNAGEMKGEKSKILHGKAALCKNFPGKNINFYIGFPFDPTNSPTAPTGCNKVRFMSSIINMDKYFAHNEVLLADELWNLLSGDTNTMQQILTIINGIATPEFETKLNFLRDNTNRINHLVEYQEILAEWNLFSELFILNNDSTIRSRIVNYRGLQSKYNNSMFKTSGTGDNQKIKYNRDRAIVLNALI